MQANGRQGPGDADQAATDGLAFTKRTLFMSAAGSALVPAPDPAAQASDQITGLAIAGTSTAAHVAPGQAAIAGKGVTAVRDPAIYRCLVHRQVVWHLPAAPAPFIATHNCSEAGTGWHPTCCRGLATAQPVRERSCMQGLLPRLQASLQQEIDRAAQAIERCCSPLEKFQVCFRQSAPASAAGCLCRASPLDKEPPLQALATLRETNQAAFYGLLSQDLTTYLPLIYTPTGRSMHCGVCSRCMQCACKDFHCMSSQPWRPVLTCPLTSGCSGRSLPALGPASAASSRSVHLHQGPGKLCSMMPGSVSCALNSLLVLREHGSLQHLCGQQGPKPACG